MSFPKNKKVFFKKSFEFPCSYIDGKLEKRLYIDIKSSNKKELFVEELTLNGFRRNYDHMYIPICTDCSLCISSRINIKNFVFSKNSKRNIKNNSDLIFEEKGKSVRDSEERYKLFLKYCSFKHHESSMGKMNFRQFEGFFYNSINNSMVYDLKNKENVIYASVLVDVIGNGYSAVYSFYDPEKQSRGLGKNIILNLVKILKSKNKEYLYLGYWVKTCRKMDYKILFDSIELFVNGKWVSKEILDF